MTKYSVASRRVKATSVSMDNGQGSGRVADRYGGRGAYAVSSAPGIVEDNNVVARGGSGRGEGVVVAFPPTGNWEEASSSPPVGQLATSPSL